MLKIVHSLDKYVCKKTTKFQIYILSQSNSIVFTLYIGFLHIFADSAFSGIFRKKIFVFFFIFNHIQLKKIKKCQKNIIFKKVASQPEFHHKCLIDEKDVYRKQMMIGSSKHDVHTKNLNKVALNRCDDKRIIQEDGISTLARGHFKLENQMFNMYISIFDSRIIRIF